VESIELHFLNEKAPFPSLVSLAHWAWENDTLVTVVKTRNKKNPNPNILGTSDAILLPTVLGLFWAPTRLYLMIRY